MVVRIISLPFVNGERAMVNFMLLKVLRGEVIEKNGVSRNRHLLGSFGSAQIQLGFLILCHPHLLHLIQYWMLGLVFSSDLNYGQLIL